MSVTRGQLSLGILLAVLVATLSLALQPVECRSTSRGSSSLPDLIGRINRSVVVVTSDDGEGTVTVGTGFCVRADGYVVTAAHVVRNGRVVVAAPSNRGGKALHAQVIGYDQGADIAILKVDYVLPAVDLAVRACRPGQQVAVIGFPFGPGIDGKLIPCSSSGIIACVRTKRVGDKNCDLLQLDVLVEEGNSGGPVFLPETGQVVGMLTTHLVPTDNQRAAPSVGFAISAQAIRIIMHQLLPGSTKKPGVR